MNHVINIAAIITISAAIVFMVLLLVGYFRAWCFGEFCNRDTEDDI